MRTSTTTLSIMWIGTKPQTYAGAINPLPPTFPIGSGSLTLTNLIDGSAIQIESQDGSTIFHNSTVSGTSKTVALQVYAPDSPSNSLRIKVRKGSAAPFYQPFETLATAAVGSQSIYVSQILD